MKKRKITLATVAQKARVSQSTVSLALNGRGRISDEVRGEIARIAQELGYTPRRKAAPSNGLRGSTVGVLIDRRFFEILDSHFLQILRGLQAESAKHGFQIVFSTVGDENVKSGWRSVLPANVPPNALVVVGVTDREFLASLHGSGIPTVLVGAGSAEPGKFDTVSSDDYQGMQEVIAHLSALGHRHIAFVGGGTQRQSAIDRLRAFKIHMDEFFGAYEPGLIEMAEEGAAQHAGFEACSALLARGAAFTALVCMNDEMARGAVEALVWSGLSVPADVSVAGFDNKEISQAITPPLTTVQINSEEMGRIACELVMLRLTEAAYLRPMRIQVAPELVVRSSTSAVGDAPPPWTRSRYGKAPVKTGQ